MDWTIALVTIVVCVGLLVGLGIASCVWFGTLVIKEGTVVDKFTEDGRHILLVQVEKAWGGGPENLRIAVPPSVYETTEIGDVVRVRYRITRFGNLGELRCTVPELVSD